MIPIYRIYLRKVIQVDIEQVLSSVECDIQFCCEQIIRRNISRNDCTLFLDGIKISLTDV